MKKLLSLSYSLLLTTTVASGAVACETTPATHNPVDDFNDAVDNFLKTCTIQDYDINQDTFTILTPDKAELHKNNLGNYIAYHVLSQQAQTHLFSFIDNYHLIDPNHFFAFTIKRIQPDPKNPATIPDLPDYKTVWWPDAYKNYLFSNNPQNCSQISGQVSINNGGKRITWPDLYWEGLITPSGEYAAVYLSQITLLDKQLVFKQDVNNSSADTRISIFNVDELYLNPKTNQYQLDYTGLQSVWAQLRSSYVTINQNYDYLFNSTAMIYFKDITPTNVQDSQFSFTWEIHYEDPQTTHPFTAPFLMNVKKIINQ